MAPYLRFNVDNDVSSNKTFSRSLTARETANNIPIHTLQNFFEQNKKQNFFEQNKNFILQQHVQKNIY